MIKASLEPRETMLLDTRKEDLVWNQSWYKELWPADSAKTADPQDITFWNAADAEIWPSVCMRVSHGDMYVGAQGMLSV